MVIVVLLLNNPLPGICACSKENAEVEAPAAAAAEEEEPEPAQMTLDEYKAQQQKHRAQAEFNLRKAGEGVDNKQWKKTYVLKKKVESEEESDEEYEASETE